MIQITQKAGVDGRLFGSVTNYDIAESLKAQGHEVTKAMVRQHAYEMFRDKLPEHPLTLEDWVLAEKDLVNSLEADDLPK